ncbi:MAG: phosphoglucosamine mutase [Planctomycetes bacterium]|nr:phosphoglucosamine mutase [Planctomycetota bacterium]
MSRQYFGTDGIRDVAGQGLLSPDLVTSYGRAIGAWLSEQKSGARVLVGRDTRASGPALIEQFGAGVLAAGHHLVDGGVLSTPAVQTLCREEKFDLAIVISASHNPAADNGLKFFGADGRKLADASEEAIEHGIAQAVEGTLPVPGIPSGVLSSDLDAGARYLEFIDRCFPELSLDGVTLVVDCAHGAGSALAPAALTRLGATLHVRGNTPDGLNINDGAGVFYVAELGALVKEHGASLGMALDGDADRVLLVDETGDVRDGDHMLGVLATDLKERGALPGDRLVTTVMANLGLKVHLANHGIACEMVPVGDRYVASGMADCGATLGGEQSGHVIFQDGPRWFGDGLYTALRILEVMQRTRRPLSELVFGIEKFPQLLVNVPVRTRTPVDEVPALVAARQVAEADLGDEGRVVLRYSGTEPLLRVMVEGRDLDRVRGHVDAMVEVAKRELG